MKIHSVLLNIFLLALISLLATYACQSRMTVALCTVADATASMDAESAQLLRKTQNQPMGKTLSCKVGEYVVITSTGGGSGDVALVRKRHLALMIDRGSTTIFDPVGTRIVFRSTQNGEPGRNVISYAAYDPSQSAWIENTDVGSNGTVDIRTTEMADRPKKIEFRLGERWFERVERDGRAGIVLDGQFMSMSEARVKLGVPGGSDPSK